MGSSSVFAVSLNNENLGERLRDSKREVLSALSSPNITSQSSFLPFFSELIETLIQKLLGSTEAKVKAESLVRAHAESCANAGETFVKIKLQQQHNSRESSSQASTQSAEQQIDYQALFKQSPSLHLILSIDFKILDASDEYLRATLTKRKDIIGKNIFDVFPDNPKNPLATGVSNVRASLERVVREKVADSMAVQRYDMDQYNPHQSPNQRGNFEERYWSVQNAPVLDRAGNIRYIIHQTIDVTDVFQSRRERNFSIKPVSEQNQVEVYQKAHSLQKVKRELERSNMELEQFAYVASHDLREPLRMIASFAQLLERRYQGKLDQKADKYIWYITDGVNRMQTLIQDILTYSRAGRGELSRETTNFETLLTRILTNLRPLIESTQARITYDPLPTLQVDPVQINQVFQNLISNALKFRQLEPIRIHISAKKQSENEKGKLGVSWCFSVEDNGIGIEPEFQTKIFALFQRLHPKDQYPGTGLGLSICKKIVERHGGEIWVKSSPGLGSTFYFTLPEDAGEKNETRSLS